MVNVVIHCNPHLTNQTESAEWLRQGFTRHGLVVDVTADKRKVGDLHVVQGPHYAYKEWLGKENVLFLNRCYWGHPRFTLSIGWLNADGSREFLWSDTPRRPIPDLKPMKPEKRKADQCAMYFGDYGEDPTNRIRETLKTYGRTYYRPHPADGRDSIVLSPDWTLEQVWEIADVAVGGGSTVLVDALVNGLWVDCWDERNPAAQDCDRETLMARLTWADWSHEEIQRGDFWEHLCIR